MAGRIVAPGPAYVLGQVDPGGEGAHDFPPAETARTGPPSACRGSPGAQRLGRARSFHHRLIEPWSALCAWLAFVRLGRGRASGYGAGSRTGPGGTRARPYVRGERRRKGTAVDRHRPARGGGRSARTSVRPSRNGLSRALHDDEAQDLRRQLGSDEPEQDRGDVHRPPETWSSAGPAEVRRARLGHRCPFVTSPHRIRSRPDEASVEPVLPEGKEDASGVGRVGTPAYSSVTGGSADQGKEIHRSVRSQV